MITLSLNNEAVTLAPGLALSQALQQWDYRDDKIAVAINGEFVPRSRYGEATLSDGDRLDIVKPVGGG